MESLFISYTTDGKPSIDVVLILLGFPSGSGIRNLPVNAGDAGSIPELGGFTGEGNATHSSILTWDIPWTEEPGELQTMGSQKSQTRLNDFKQQALALLGSSET